MKTILAFLVLLAPATASAQTVVGTYSSGISLLAFHEVTPDSVFRLRMIYGQQPLLDLDLPFSAINNSAFALIPPPQVNDGVWQGITMGVTSRNGSIDGLKNFGEDDLTFAYEPHTSIDFYNEAAITEIRLSFEHFSAIQTEPRESIVGGLATVEFIGYKIVEVPEPGTWVLCLVGILLIGAIWTQSKSRNA